MKHKVKLRYTVVYEVDAYVDAPSARAAMDLAIDQLNRNLLPPFQPVRETKPGIASVEDIKK